MDDPKEYKDMNLFEIVAGGKKYYFWVKAAIKDIPELIRESDWLVCDDEVLRCRDITSVKLICNDLCQELN